jgi:hypothetical protein
VVSLREEVNNTTKLIAKSTSRPLAVALSGGIDSEIICRSLHEQGIDFTIFIMRFSNEYNSKDIQWAFNFCSEHNIDPKVLDIDIIKFMEQGTRNYIHGGYKSHEIFRYLQLWLMEQVSDQGYSLIMGGREEPITCYNDTAVVRYDPGHLMAHEWNRDHGNYHYPSFFETTPELMAAYLGSPIIKLICQDYNYFVEDSYGASPEKILVLHHSWPEMKRRFKMNGFEQLHPIKNKHQKVLKLRMPTLENLHIPVVEIQQQLGI